MSKTLKYICIAFSIVFFVAIFNLSQAFANGDTKFYLEPSNNNPTISENFTVNVIIEPSSNVNIATFLLKLNFDSTKLKYTGLFSNFNSDDFKTYLNGDLLQVIYLTNENGINIDQNSPSLFLELNFKVLSTASEGNSNISGNVEGLCSYDENRLNVTSFESTSINISKTPENDCNLSSLKAEDYKLVPEFNPLITKYNVAVPSSKSSIEISATPSDPEATVKVSRKNLNAAGKSTDITVTVTGIDKKSKKVYVVTVLRDDKAYKASSSSNNGNSKSSKSSGSNNSKSAKLSGDSENDSNSGLTIVQGNFNFILFFTVCAICVIIAIYIIKEKNKKI